jgi:hypothetical protein
MAVVITPVEHLPAPIEARSKRAGSRGTAHFRASHFRAARFPAMARCGTLRMLVLLCAGRCAKLQAQQRRTQGPSRYFESTTVHDLEETSSLDDLVIS